MSLAQMDARFVLTRTFPRAGSGIGISWHWINPRDVFTAAGIVDMGNPLYGLVNDVLIVCLGKVRGYQRPCQTDTLKQRVYDSNSTVGLQNCMSIRITW